MNKTLSKKIKIVSEAMTNVVNTGMVDQAGIVIMIIGLKNFLREIAGHHQMDTNERQQIKQIIESAQNAINDTFYSSVVHVNAEDATYSGQALRVFESMCASLDEVVNDGL